MSKPVIRLDDFPIVHIVFQADPVLADVQAFLKDLRPVFKRGKMAFLSDINLLQHAKVNAQMRQSLANGIDQLVSEFPDRLVAEAVIAGSPLVRGMYVAYSWLKKKKPYPSKAFKTGSEARRWAQQQLQTARAVRATDAHKSGIEF